MLSNSHYSTSLDSGQNNSRLNNVRFNKHDITLIESMDYLLLKVDCPKREYAGSSGHQLIF